jgi:glutamate racemase
MENRSIGVFDSGVGGLTVMKQLLQTLPEEHFIYFGDTARIPYGGKSRETIIRYSIENAIFLVEQNIKMLVVACNTATAHALEKLQKIFNIPIIGVIEPNIEKAVRTTKNQHIAVLGTQGTIRSEVYQQNIKKFLPNATIFPIACPLFVHLVEEKFVHHPATLLIIQEYLRPLRHHPIDTVLLGCTHYPLLKQLIMKELGKHVSVIDSAPTCAEKVAELLNQLNLKRAYPNTQNHQYFVSDDPKKFQIIGEELLGEPIENVSLLISYQNISL